LREASFCRPIFILEGRWWSCSSGKADDSDLLGLSSETLFEEQGPTQPSFTLACSPRLAIIELSPYDFAQVISKQRPGEAQHGPPYADIPVANQGRAAAIGIQRVAAA
jgi:hypothetical protein